MHSPSQKRRRPSTPGTPADERRRFFGRRRFELARDLLTTITPDDTFRDVNPAWERALGWERGSLVGQSVVAFVHPDDREAMLEQLSEVRQGRKQRVPFETRCLTRSGDWAWLEWHAHSAAHEGLVYASAHDIGARKRREAELEHAAHVDPLTGLANRRGFERALERELAAADRHSLRPALIVVDLDHFKEINDHHGHQAGDELLVAAASTLSETVRASDLPARVGGDEFAVLLPDADLGTAQLVASKIVGRLRDKALGPEGADVNLSASAGVALIGHGGVSDKSELVAAADRALYRAKRRRSSFIIHGPTAD